MKTIPGKGPLQAARDEAYQNGALVMYENDGVPLLAAISGARKDKYALFNERGREADLPVNRLYSLPGRLPADCAGIEQKTQHLSKLHKDSETAAESVNLEDLWSVIKDEEREYSCKECCELIFADNSLEHHLITRFAMMADKVYFKRNRDTFAPRPETTVAELKKAEAARTEKERARNMTLSCFKARLENPAAPLPPESAATLRLLEDTAAACDLDHSRQKEVKELLELCSQGLGLELNGTREQQAFSLLLKIGHFSHDTNLALIRYRPALSFSDQAEDEARNLPVPKDSAALPEEDRRVRQDFTNLEAFTIDDISTRDMDDALSLERTPEGYRLGVHVSDVALVLPPDSHLDREIRQRATSIYLPERTIHMLPDSLAAEKLSLVAGQVRPCLSCMFTLDSDLKITSSSIVPSLVKITRRYTYDEVDELLENQGSAELNTIYTLTVNQEMERSNAGAQKVFKHDLMIKIEENGEVQLEEFDEHGPARALVGETMIMANALLAAYARDNGIPVAFRSQEAPEETEEIMVPQGPAYDYAQRARLKRSLVSLTPAPHSSLGLSAYIQTTSPIRRYLDLCNQRQILHHLRTGKPFYTAEQFEKLLQETEQPLSDTQQIQKETRRYWLLRYLQQRSRKRSASGERDNLLRATVLRIDLRNPLVELDEVFMPAILKVTRPVQPGDELTVRVAAVDPRTDYLKLEMVS